MLTFNNGNNGNNGNGGDSPGKYEDLQFFYHPDHLGSSNYITDASGEVYQHNEYFPYGETFVEERNNTEYTTYLFSGKELDVETGLYYFHARYYDPRTSVFLNIDPMSDKYPHQSNYTYCSNNPIMRIDPDGRTDFFDNDGIYLGNNGVDDGKVSVVIDKSRLFDYLTNRKENVNWGGTLSDSQIRLFENLSNEVDMDSDLGYMIRAVYAEMRGGDDNAKSIVAESIYNRSQMEGKAYEKADGTYKGIVNKFYDVSKPTDRAYDSFENPGNYIYKNEQETNAWRGSVSASIKANSGKSNVGKGVIFYNSASSTYYDKNPKMEKITLDFKVKGVKGLWKLK